MANIDANKRHKVFMKTFYHCGYCGKILTDTEDLTIDHIIPQANGGKNEISNLIGCCHNCNMLKADLHYNTFRKNISDSIKTSNLFTGEKVNENVTFFFEKYCEDDLKKINTLN